MSNDRPFDTVFNNDIAMLDDAALAERLNECRATLQRTETALRELAPQTFHEHVLSNHSSSVWLDLYLLSKQHYEAWMNWHRCGWERSFRRDRDCTLSLLEQIDLGEHRAVFRQALFDAFHMIDPELFRL